MNFPHCFICADQPIKSVVWFTNILTGDSFDLLDHRPWLPIKSMILYIIGWYILSDHSSTSQGAMGHSLESLH